MQPYSLHIADRLFLADRPLIMAVINVTPDSFAQHCCHITEAEVLSCAARALQEGAAVLDIGGESTRPGSTPVSQEEEWRRLQIALRAIRSSFPNAVISVDTRHAAVAQRAIEEFHADIINDISGCADPAMAQTVSRARTPYILTHMRGTPQTMQEHAVYNDVVAEVIAELAACVDRLHRAGVRDILVDPGFGFAKTTEHNWQLLRRLGELNVLGCPIVAGISRKTMLQQAVGCEPGEALNATTAAHMEALSAGVAWLRVHDVRQALETIMIAEKLHY